MRVSLFVSALFAASLFGGAVMADQPGEGGGRTARLPNVVQDLKVKQARETRMERPHETPQTKVVRETRVTERFRNRGDMVDRYSTKTAAPGKAARDVSSAKTGADLEKAARMLNKKQEAARNCAPTDESCASYGKTTGPAKAAAADQMRSENKQADVVKKMIEKRLAEKMKARILKAICEKNANMCDANL